MKKTKLYLVDTLVTFRNRYIVEAECLEHAYDEVTMVDSGHEDDFFEPFSQKLISEQIIDGRKISMKKFHKLNRDLEEDKDPRESGNPWLGEEVIRVINYNDSRGSSLEIPMSND